MNKSILLSEVKIVEKKQAVTRSANLNGAGNADAVLTSYQLQQCNNLAECMIGRVAGLLIENGIPYLTRYVPRRPMQLVVDGVPTDASYLAFINPNDVETIEVLRSLANTAIYGIQGNGGVLVITSKQGTINPYRSFSPGILSYSPKGFYKVREFYSPNYDDPKIDTKAPDLRTTIYWNPNIVTDHEGKAYVEFFNADGKGNYKVVVEGVTVDGKVGRTVYRYVVN
jgi:hypothetical protein